MSPADLVQRQFDAYNAQDIDAFMSCYAEGAVLGVLYGEVHTRGAAAVRERHVNLFRTHPENRARLLNRIAFGDLVIDHEAVERAPDGEKFQVAAIYTIRDGLIARVDFAR